jgi:hypothetical protein
MRLEKRVSYSSPRASLPGLREPPRQRPRLLPASGTVTVTMDRRNGTAAVRIDDEGPGIPETHQKRSHPALIERVKTFSGPQNRDVPRGAPWGVSIAGRTLRDRHNTSQADSWMSWEHLADASDSARELRATARTSWESSRKLRAAAQAAPESAQAIRATARKIREGCQGEKVAAFSSREASRATWGDARVIRATAQVIWAAPGRPGSDPFQLGNAPGAQRLRARHSKGWAGVRGGVAGSFLLRDTEAERIVRIPAGKSRAIRAAGPSPYRLAQVADRDYNVITTGVKP